MCAVIMKTDLSNADGARNSKRKNSTGRELDMTSKASIKRKLPPAPKTATKTVHDNRFLGEGINTYIHKPSPSPMDDFGQSENTKENAARSKKQEMERKHKIMKSLLKEGATDEEIAAATGYSNGSVRKILAKWRREGVDVSDRKRGRKKNEKEGKEKSH